MCAHARRGAAWEYVICNTHTWSGTPWQTDISRANQEIPHLLKWLEFSLPHSQKPTTELYRETNTLRISHTISLRSIAILTSSLFLLGIQAKKFFAHFSFPCECYCHCHLIPLNYSFQVKSEFMELIILNFSASPCTSSGPNIFVLERHHCVLYCPKLRDRVRHL